MLFDLRNPGRRRLIKVVYVFLAILIAGGLVVFGIGGASNGGDPFDAIFGGGGSSQPVSPTAKQEEQLAKKLQANPKDVAGWLKLASLRASGAQSLSSTDPTTNATVYSSEGKKELSRAAVAWQKYLALNPKKVDPKVATQMVMVYGPDGLNELNLAADTQAIVAKAAPNAQNYYLLAIYYYLTTQLKLGDAASKQAKKLAPKDARARIKTQLDQLRAQAVLKQQQQQSQGNSPLPSSPSKPKQPPTSGK
jgi:hypothetical protein